MTSFFDINLCKHYHLQQELHFLHITIYRWKILPSFLTRYFNTQLLTTKWQQYETMITEKKIELSSPSTRLPQKTPLYHSVTDKVQQFVDSTCSTHNTQNDANHGVMAWSKSSDNRCFFKIINANTPSVKLKTSSVVAACTGGVLFIEIAAVFNGSKQKFLLDTGSMVSIINFVVVDNAVVLSLSNPFLQSMEKLFEARKSIPRILQDPLAT